MQTTDKEMDKFELHLNEMIKKVQESQKQKGVSSCSECSEFFSCAIRDEYVKAVYNSMSKGDTGGFEF